MADPIKRLNYFNGQFLREPDFDDEQGYHLRHQRDHARLLHTPGIAEGLDIPDPAAGATAVVVNAGAAFDDQGRRIVLADNYVLELADEPADQTVYVTIAYAESETDPTDETGITGNTRRTESPLIETLPSAPANSNEKLVLARIERSGNIVGTVHRDDRRTAGVKGGDLEVHALTLTSDSVAPSGWVQAQLEATGQAALDGSLRVAGNLVVDGSIQGNIAVNTVETGDLVDDAVSSAKLAAADGTSAQDTGSGTGVKTGHIQDGAVTLQKLASAVQPIVSIEGVSSPGGNVDLATGGAITVTPDPGNKRITIGETHSSRTDNPHAATAAQVGALASTGGALSGNLQVNGYVGINTAPSHRLYIAAGDETDGQTYGVVSVANTGTAANLTTAFQGNAGSSGNGTVQGISINATGNGTGQKNGMSCYASGADGVKNAGQFTATTSSTTSSAYTRALYAYASTTGTGSAEGLNVTATGNGTGTKTGVNCNVSGADGVKHAGQFTAGTSSTTSSANTQALYAYANTAGTGSAEGLNVTASGDGTGTKTGVSSNVFGAEGTKYAGQFTASTSSTTSGAYTRALAANASTAGIGSVRGLDVSATSDGSGVKYGVYCSVSGAEGSKYAGQFNANTSSTTSSAYTVALYTRADNAGTGNTYGLQCYAFGAGTGPKYALLSSVGGGGTTQYAGFFNGNVHVQGSISTTGPKPFLIDHPLDPYNKTLRHNAVESPEELCLYRGKVALDGNGKGTVKMSTYFAALTQEDEATVVLTPIGKKPFVASYEWERNFDAFTVHGEPNGQVSYVVLANRDDPTVKLLRRPVEEEKSGADKGKLLSPESYGQPPEKGIAPLPVAPAAAEAGAMESTEEQAKKIAEEAKEREKAHKAERDRIERDLKERDEEHKRMREEREATDEKRKQKERETVTERERPGPHRDR